MPSWCMPWPLRQCRYDHCNHGLDPVPIITDPFSLCLPTQFAYVMLVGTFPFNGFLAGFLSSIGFFALTGPVCPHAVHTH